MTGTPLDLLRLLGSGVRALAPARAASPAKGEEPGAFAAALEKARAGDVRSGIPVRVADGLPLELTADQLERLGAAADRAEAHGASRALVLIDSMALTVDVATRTITGTVDLAGVTAVAGIDAVITAPGGASAPLPVVAPPAPGPGVNASLNRVLSDAERAA